MKKKLLCLLLSVLLIATAAQAAEKPNLAVDISRSCTLTLQYAASGQTIRLYHVADISSVGSYTLRGAFAEYGIYMPAGQSQTEWEALRDTLMAYISADSLAPDSTAVTGTDGKAVFTGLSAGLYLSDRTDMQVGDNTYQYATALFAVPGADGYGAWTYDVTAVPKHTEKPSDGGNVPTTPVTYTVVKLWAGEEDLDERPGSVEVTICKDGIEQEKQILSSVNDWTYQWTASDGTWSVLERDVPEGYAVTVQHSGSRFFVTNTWSGLDSTPTPETAPEQTPTPEPTPTPTPGSGDRPQTGDASRLTLYIVSMAVSGLALVLLGAASRKQKHEKE